MSQIALLINPWIYDFSAYDLWMRPVGLLRIASHLRKEGFNVMFFDCLDSRSRNDNFGCGKFNKKLIPKPEQIKNIPRAYYRYGVPIERFIEYLKEIPRPDVVYVNSGMTYWYLGVKEVIRLVRNILGDVKIILGGVYANLCKEHAKNLGVNEIWNGKRLDVYPAWDLLNSPRPDVTSGRGESLVIQTSFGCPFNCSYCGTNILSAAAGGFYQRPYSEVVDEIEYYAKRLSPKDIAFYDDALLANPDKHIKPLLSEIIRRKIKIRFHTPNGIHARFVDRELAGLMKKAGFVTIRISLETSKTNRCDNKVTNSEFLQAIAYLKEAGFSGNEIAAYTMFGSLEDSPENVVSDIKFVTEEARVPIKLSTYSLVPGSDDYKRWGFSDELDPLWHNKTIFPLFNKRYTIDIIRRLRGLAKTKNNSIIISN